MASEQTKLIELYFTDYTAHKQERLTQLIKFCQNFLNLSITEKVVGMQGNGDSTKIVLLDVLSNLFEEKEPYLVSTEFVPLGDERYNHLRYIILDHPKKEMMDNVETVLAAMNDENYVGIKPNVTFILQTKQTSVQLNRIKTLTKPQFHILNNRNLDHQFSDQITQYRYEMREYINQYKV